MQKKIKINLQLKKKYVSLHPLSREQHKIIDNTERDNEVKKEKDIVCMKAGPGGPGVMRGNINFTKNRRENREQK